MTNIFKTSFGFAVGLALTGSALALPFTQPNASLNFQDFDALGTSLSAGQSIQGSFNILTSDVGSTTIMAGYANAGAIFSDIGGYVPNTPILAATAYFYIRNGNNGNDTVTINLSGTQLFADNTDASFAILDGAASIAILQTNGIVNYTVSQSGTSGGSNFTVDYAQLQVTTGPSTPRGVPDGGGTIGLLGFGLAGLALIKRKTQGVR